MDQTADALDQLADTAIAGQMLDDGSDDTQIKVINLIIKHGIREDLRPAGKSCSCLLAAQVY